MTKFVNDQNAAEKLELIQKLEADFAAAAATPRHYAAHPCYDAADVRAVYSKLRAHLKRTGAPIFYQLLKSFTIHLKTLEDDGISADLVQAATLGRLEADHYIASLCQLLPPHIFVAEYWDELEKIRRSFQYRYIQVELDSWLKSGATGKVYQPSLTSAERAEKAAAAAEKAAEKATAAEKAAAAAGDTGDARRTAAKARGQASGAKTRAEKAAAAAAPLQYPITPRLADDAIDARLKTVLTSQQLDFLTTFTNTTDWRALGEIYDITPDAARMHTTRLIKKLKASSFLDVTLYYAPECTMRKAVLAFFDRKHSDDGKITK